MDEERDEVGNRNNSENGFVFDQSTMSCRGNMDFATHDTRRKHDASTVRGASVHGAPNPHAYFRPRAKRACASA